MMTNQMILDYHWEFKDTDAKSIREYFKNLLTTLWEEGEGFSGKRPFGNSGWEYDLYYPLVKMGAVKGEWDYIEEYAENIDKAAANTLIYELIEEIFE